MQKSIIRKSIVLICLGIIIIWSNKLPGITFSGIGTLFPLRIVAPIFGTLFLIRRDNHSLYRKTVNRLLPLLMYGVFSLIWCMDVSTGFSVLLIYVTSVFSVFTVFELVKDEKEIVYLCRVIAINALIIGLMGIYESATGHYFNITKDRYTYSWVVNTLGWKYPHAIFHNTNDFSTFMVAMLPIICIAVNDLKFRQTIQYIGFAFCAFCVFLTNSRLGIILSGFYLIWMLPKKTIQGIASGVFILTIVLYIGIKYWNDISESFLAILNISLGDEDRIQIWGNCFFNIFRTKTFGVGVGNSVLANYEFQVFNTDGIYSPHNFFLEIFEEFGLFGFMCFISWFLIIYKNLKQFSDCETGKYLLSFLVLYVFLSICSSSIRQDYYFWSVFALCLVYVKNKLLEITLKESFS